MKLTIQIPRGWRLLKRGILRKDDKFRDLDGQWDYTLSAGQNVEDRLNMDIYIRRVAKRKTNPKPKAS